MRRYYISINMAFLWHQSLNLGWGPAARNGGFYPHDGRREEGKWQGFVGLLVKAFQMASQEVRTDCE